MKYLFISLIIFSMIFIGCNKEECGPITPPVDDRIPFEINFLQYSDNNYFIDQVYADTSGEFDMYNQFYGSITPIILPNYYVKNIEVYKSANSIFDEGIIATAFINLPPRSSDSMYADELRNINTIIPGQNDASLFILLDEGNDYIFHRETGWITFINPPTDQDIIAVAYKIENEPGYTDDLIYGEFISELVNNSKTRGVLKLVKPRDLQPVYEDAWNLKMKNIYQISSQLGYIRNLDLDIYLKKSDGTESNTYNNIRLLELFGLDRLSENGMPVPDGKYDYSLGMNFEPRTSEIIFPVIQPFGNNMPYVLNQYKYQVIYDTMKIFLSMPGNSFIIKGKYK